MELVKKGVKPNWLQIEGGTRGGLGVVWVCGQLRGGLKESSGGWHLGLPMSRPSPELCHKSPDICQVALPPAQRKGQETVYLINLQAATAPAFRESEPD